MWIQFWLQLYLCGLTSPSLNELYQLKNLLKLAELNRLFQKYVALFGFVSEELHLFVVYVWQEHDQRSHETWTWHVLYSLLVQFLHLRCSLEAVDHWHVDIQNQEWNWLEYDSGTALVDWYDTFEVVHCLFPIRKHHQPGLGPHLRKLSLHCGSVEGLIVCIYHAAPGRWVCKPMLAQFLQESNEMIVYWNRVKGLSFSRWLLD